MLTLSHKGKRESNQDLILTETLGDGSYLLAVIDGMGGYEHGDLAAKLVEENIAAYISTVDVLNFFHIQKAINKANLAIRQKNELLSSNMGATIGGVIIKDSTATFFWVGDIKVFHFRNNHLLFESYSHNLINDLIESGSITEPNKLSKFKNVVTRSIHGDVKSSKAEFHVIQNLLDSDIIIVCSDGVHNLFDGIQIEKMLIYSKTKENLFDAMTNRLLEEASDNFSLGIVSYP